MKLKLFKYSSILLLSFSVHANTLTISFTGNSGTTNILQDGQDNSIISTVSNYNSGSINYQQTGNYNSIDVDVTGGSGTGSYLNVYQNGSDSYSADLICLQSWCGLTVSQ